MTEYSTDSHINTICIRIAEELEAHANSRAYTDDADLAIKHAYTVRCHTLNGDNL